jgi:FtsZ-interacting cell division protein ZipA
MSTKKNKKVKPISQVNINTSSIRQLLLDKLKEHKKTRKIETKITPLQEKTFDESCKEIKVEETKLNESKINDSNNSNNSNEVKSTQNQYQSQYQNQSQSQPQNQNELCSPDKPYGNLKNGTKPTYKQMNQIPRENSRENPRETIDTMTMSPMSQMTPTTMTMPKSEPIILEEKEVKKTFILGKNDKTRTISVLIKNNKTRKCYHYIFILL